MMVLVWSSTIVSVGWCAQTEQSSTAGATPGQQSLTSKTEELPPSDLKAFADFTNWIQQYRQAASPEAKTALEAQGVALAQARRAALALLMDTNPQRALELALPFALRSGLPTAVAQNLEEPISGRGDLMVLSIDRIDPKTGAMTGQIQRTVKIGGKSYRARVYGRRLRLTSKMNIPLHGIVIDRTMAVHESPVRVLEMGEVPDPKMPLADAAKHCPVCGADAANGIAADIGGVIYYFDTEDDLAKYRTALESRENIIGPDVAGP